jgi:hypothetical protein
MRREPTEKGEACPEETTKSDRGPGGRSTDRLVRSVQRRARRRGRAELAEEGDAGNGSILDIDVAWVAGATSGLEHDTSAHHLDAIAGAGLRHAAARSGQREGRNASRARLRGGPRPRHWGFGRLPHPTGVRCLQPGQMDDGSAD